MGAAASTSQKPMTEVDIKNSIGVLYETTGAEKSFKDATGKDAGEDAVVAWAAVKAFAEQHDKRLLDPRHCMFQNLKAFKEAREQIDELARVHIKGAVKEIPWRGKDLGNDARQHGPDGAPAKTLEDLYAIAEVAREEYEKVMTAACSDSAVELTITGLKSKARAKAKASAEYTDKAEPFVSWLFDVVRGSVMCETEADIVSLYEALKSNPDVEIVRIKNRFDPPNFNGYRDVLMNVAVKVENVSHLCELQIHLKAIKDSEPEHMSHLTYEFFRSYFLGNKDAVEKRLKLLMALPVDDAKDVGELVELMLGSDQYAGQLGGLCELLTSIQESAGVVKVREAILAEKERAFGAESKEAGVALYNLGLAYGVGQNAKRLEVLERALLIYEREYGKDSSKVATVLNDLSLAYMGLGDYAKQQDVLERALPIREREYGHDHSEVAATLGNLANAYGALGDQAKKRDMLERALAIQERTYGPDHAQVAGVLTNLGVAYNDLGDHACARDVLERALAIFERAYGRDSTQVATTLTNLGNAYGSLGKHAKKRDVLERGLAIDERTYGRDHEQVAFPLANLGVLCQDLGDQAKAREYYGRAHAIWERAYGPEHEMTQRVRACLDSVS